MTSAAPSEAATAHEHAWPLTADDWDALVGCRTCGLLLLRGFVGSARWVVRRVEGIDFVDDRTVRRRVSVDYTVPRAAVTLRVDGDKGVRILPLALMRRKNMINFDFRDHDGRPMPLLGLRENQALTLAVVRAWAETTIRHTPSAERPEISELLDDIIAGDQSELHRAYRGLEARKKEQPNAVPDELIAVLERLAGNFVLFASEPAAPGTRRVVKWSYDEPLTLLHSTTSYRGHADGPCPGDAGEANAPPLTYGRTGHRLAWRKPAPLLAGLGIRPTRIRFPTPGAELAASFHLEITAPPEVSIVEASLLAGTPNLRFDSGSPAADQRRWKRVCDAASGDGARRARARRRPSFDSVAGGYPTVDLHVADVPYGSLSRAQVELQASPTGWLASAWFTTVLATALLFAAAWANPSGPDSAELPTAVLVSFAAAMVAIVVRPDPHVMVTRLLTRLRMLAAASAVLVLAGGCAFAFRGSADSQTWLFALAGLSVLPTGVITYVWWCARRRLVRDRPPTKKTAERRRQAREEPLAGGEDTRSWDAPRRRLQEVRRAAPMIRLSPWEQHLPDHDLGDHVDTDFHVLLSETLENADYPYDRAVVELGFDKPAIKVASLEGDRSTFRWTLDFENRFWELLDAELDHAPATGRFTKTATVGGTAARPTPSARRPPGP